MANSRQRPDSSAFVAENEIDVVLAGAYPNPAREGCPPADVIEALARRERPLDDPDWRHVFKCSDCYREVRALQQAAGERREGFEEPRRWWPAVAAAAVLVLAVAGGWFVWSRPETGTTPATDAPAHATSVEARANWDYRKYTVTRSDANQTELPPLLLPRRPDRVAIQLPPGFLPGEYEVQLLDADLRSRASARGVAEMRDGAATIETAIDVSELPAGRYQVAVRREGESWRLFPAELR
jgi:hypothetical protein